MYGQVERIYVVFSPRFLCLTRFDSETKDLALIGHVSAVQERSKSLAHFTHSAGPAMTVVMLVRSPSRMRADIHIVMVAPCSKSDLNKGRWCNRSLEVFNMWGDRGDEEENREMHKAYILWASMVFYKVVQGGLDHVLCSR